MKIYCSGIGGIGLSAFAAYQAASGHEVLGSDRSDSALIADLRSQGITVTLNQDGSGVPSDCDLFVYSEAVPSDAPERVRAREFGIQSQSYFHALGELTQNAFVIAVCGTHGKSSTTAMVAKVLMDTGRDPSVIVGTKMTELGGRNWRKGKSDIFVVEACEYRRSFHYISPDIVLMTNVDGDHFDAFANMAEYRDAFVTFVKRLPQDGTVITHMKDEGCASVVADAGKETIDADAFASPTLGVPGMHMRDNARLVVALAEKLSIPVGDVAESLASFHGTWRRMEVKGVKNGVTIVDDYAHHPVEISATLHAMREAYPTGKIICIFQPHTHDRTLKLYDEFIASFGDADRVIIPDIYNARSDIETAMVDVDHFVADIRRASATDAVNSHGLDGAMKAARDNAASGDVIIVMGAGNVTALADDLLQ